MTKIFFMFFTGLITTMFGVGGIENSITDLELVQSCAVAFVGLAILYCATLMQQQEQ